MAKINIINMDRIEEEISWTSEESDEFWEQMVNDMESEGYDRRDQSYHWVEMSYYKYGETDWFCTSEEDRKELCLYIED